MPNLPSWVDAATSPMARNSLLGGQQPNNSMLNKVPMLGDQNGSGILGGNDPSHKPYTNPNPWDGLGADNNKIANDGVGMNGAITPGSSNYNQTVAGLPPQVQQMLQMFMNQGGGGFQGFAPVQGNPFQNNGANIQNWGQNPNNGLYGGT